MTASLALCCVWLAGGSRDAVAQPAPETVSNAVIAPGQEELLAEMLGRGVALPGGCKLTDGRVEYSVVKAIYTCPSGEVVFALAHRDEAEPGATETDRFVITLRSGTPPDDLLPAVLARIRPREADFQWTMLGEPRRFSPALVVVGCLLAIVVAGWILRTRASARRAQRQ